MRTIKFRGKITGDVGNWVIGYYHYDKATKTHYICDEDTLVRFEVDPETVGQFTGIKDQDGKDIYEGDIIDYNHSLREYNFPTFKGVIFFDGESKCGWAIKREQEHSNNFQWDVCKVIGNTTDSPTLLTPQ